MEAEGRLRVRVNAYPLYNDAILDEDGDTILMHTWYRDHAPILDPYRMLRIPTVKIFVDGTSDSLHGCMALRDPYPEPFRSTPEFQEACFDDMVGDLFMSQEELTAAVQEIQARGYRVAFHAMGDAAVEQALNAIQIATGGFNFPRHQIHHNALIGPDQIDRYRSLGILASVRGYWNTCNQDDYAYWVGSDRQPWTVNRFALIHEGVKAFGEGDFGWGANPDDMASSNPINPFLTVYGLVTHRQLRADETACEPAPWVSIHNVDAQTALEMVTINAAYANSQEGVIGSIQVDKLADVIVITGDPLTLPPEDIKNIRVLMTMVGGRTEYCAADSGGVCP
jgi:predicted amidohydrolase YtcJ